MPAPRLLFVSNLFPDASSPQRGLDNATLLHALRPRWEVRALSTRPTLPFRWHPLEPRPLDCSLEPVYLPVPYLPKIGSRVNHRWMARALRSRLVGPERWSADVVLASWLYPDACAVARLAREAGFPFVAIAQGSDAHAYLDHPVRRRLIVEAMQTASAVVTRSAELARLLNEAGVPAEKLHPIYNGIDHRIFQPGDRLAARRALGWPEEAPVILFVGNFYPVKNPLVLVNALARLAGDPALPGARLVLAGGGPLEGTLRALATQHGLTARVHFAGRQPPAEIARLMQAANVLALPSRNEGVPNVILEAFGCGLPVVASQVGGIAEVHQGDAFGRLVPPGAPEPLAAAFREVLLAPPPSAPLVAHGAAFTWERTAGQYEALLIRATGLA